MDLYLVLRKKNMIYRKCGHLRMEISLINIHVHVHLGMSILLVETSRLIGSISLAIVEYLLIY